jgi:xylulokinase
VSIVPVDASGTPTHNMILWMDRRGARYNLAIYENHEDALPYWLDVHGLPPSPVGGISLAHMQWIQHERPEVYENTHAFLEPADYVTCRLTGEVVSNPCTVFPLLLTDHRHPDQVAYDDKLVEMSGLDPDKLPPLLDKSATVGNVLPELAAELGLSLDVPVLAPVNDTQSVTIATGAIESTMGGLSIGTTSVLVSSMHQKKSDLATSMLSMPSPLPGEYNVMAENGLGGKVLEQFLEQWMFPNDSLADSHLEDPYQALNEAVKQVPAGSNGVFFLPWLGGSLAPNSKDYVRAGFMNLSIHNTRPDMARSVLEGLCMNIRWLLEAVQEFTGTQLETITIGGGPARLGSLCQVMADVLARPVRQMESPHAIASCGAALLTFQRLGYIDKNNLKDCVVCEHEYQPTAENVETYNQKFQHFLGFFEANQELYQQLNQ